MTTTRFKVSDDIELSSISTYSTVPTKERISQNNLFSSDKFEAFDSQSQLVHHDNFPHKLSLNGFAETIHLAYDQHHGLTLAPHHLWIVILQGLAIHVNLNGEKCKSTLGIQHEGKVNLDVRRDNFVLGEDNPWQEVFPEFVDGINGKVNNTLSQLISKPFSTSDKVAVAVTALTIMDLYKNYFTYSVTTMCGIPEIGLLGTVEDWEDLIDRSQKVLNQFEDLKYWTEELIPVLNEFVKVKKNNSNVNKEFWTSFYKPSGGSGGPFIRGWINVFYPYLQADKDYVQNQYINWKQDYGMFSGLTYDQIPVGFTKTPFTWNYYNEKFKMNFIGGFLGTKKSTINQNHIEPAISWFINYE
ncbi:hypothetical protein K502DRAFT_335075 [Neoconidiobolus thromboides FSU 785]|nr:hypothetical protein K502DRAFT_335075 [Neoconidiobolus thromboides FSU 785]